MPGVSNGLLSRFQSLLHSAIDLIEGDWVRSLLHNVRGSDQRFVASVLKPERPTAQEIYYKKIAANRSRDILQEDGKLPHRLS